MPVQTRLTASFCMILLLSCCGLLAQAPVTPDPAGAYHKNIYLEGLGAPIVLGINFDMRFEKGRMDGAGFRAGLGGGAWLGEPGTREGMLIFPLEVNYLVGPGRHAFVAGAGLLPVYSWLSYGVLKHRFDAFTGDGFGVAGGFLTVGYRYQPLGRGLMFQLHWSPLITRGSGFQPGWGGIGVGMGFK